MAKATRVFSTPSTPIDTTRRHLLTIAAGSAVAAAIPARAYPGHDPIFAAIDAFRRADASCVAVHDGDIPDELGDRRGDAMRAVMRTCPTTPAGLVALTGWTREQADWLEKNGSNLFADDLSALTATIDDAARGMSGLEPWSPPLQAAAAIDPIYAAIERHKAAGAVWNAAVDVELPFPEGPEPMTDEQWEQRDELDDVVDDARELLVDAGVDLVGTKPTTHGGIIAAVSFIRTQMRDDGTYMPCASEVEWKFEYTELCGGDSRDTMGWIDAFLNTIADAAAALDKAVQS
jgi:hypothetical protein